MIQERLIIPHGGTQLSEHSRQQFVAVMETEGRTHQYANRSAITRCKLQRIHRGHLLRFTVRPIFWVL